MYVIWWKILARVVLHGMGLEPVTEEFVSARSKYRPYALAAGVNLFCVVLFELNGKIGTLAALGLQMFNLVAVILELNGQPNPLRWILPKGNSQNVYALLQPRGEVKRQVVLVAHLDTNRTPLLNSNHAWELVFLSLLPASFVSAIALIALLTAWLVVPLPVFRILALLPALVFLAAGLLMLQADLTPYTVGADDNASAVGDPASVPHGSVVLAGWLRRSSFIWGGSVRSSSWRAASPGVLDCVGQFGRRRWIASLYAGRDFVA